jgi:ABC-2 type transport system permease protein
MVILTIMPLVVLSGNLTPSESMPVFVQNIMLAFPTTHYVSCAQGILYRSAGLDIVWPQMAVLICIGMVYFSISLTRFRKMLSQMG